MSDALQMIEEDESAPIAAVGAAYTYADYLGWEGPERYELFDGEAFLMSAPSVAHQAILMELSYQFSAWLRGKPCRVLAAPVDVRLFPEEDNSDDTVVQPDLLVVCDKEKLGKGSVNGAPDLAIEILSPSNSAREMLLKFQYYLDAGVREYWTIEPDEKKVLVHIAKDGHFISSSYKEDARIPVTALPGLTIDLQSLWNAAGV